MKYFRTKDGIYQSVFFKIGVDSETGEEYLTGRDTKIHTPNNKIINQADTIEELCDEFVIDEIGHYQYGDFETAKAMLETIHEKGKLYGAIWTDRGLIYIAKMNEEGALELL